MEQAGYIIISKKLLKWEWIDDPMMLSLWINLLLKANYEDKKWHGVVIERGQFVTSLGKLAKEVGITMQALRTRLDRLQEGGCINKQTTNKYTTITICKYDEYQLEPDFYNKQITNEQQTNNKQITTTNKVNKENKYNITPISPKGDSPKKAKKPAMDERKKAFYETIIPYVEKYGKEMCREFYDYWTEPYQSGIDKMRFEGQKTWSISGRLATWAKKEQRYGTNKEHNPEMARQERFRQAAAVMQDLIENGIED